MSELVKRDDGIYVELPKDKIKFVSKEAEVMFDLSMENDYLKKEIQELKSERKALLQSISLLQTHKKTYKRRAKKKVHEAREQRDKYKQMYEMEKALFINADLKIERAIEYIENNFCGDLAITFGKDLLEILKGDNND